MPLADTLIRDTIMKAQSFLYFIPLFLIATVIPPAERKNSFSEITPAAVQTPFEKAMLLLHNFEYDDAAELFMEVQSKEPAFALAYWGEAMTYDHPIWGDLDIEKARAALHKLGDTPESRVSKGKTALEKDLIAAANVLFGEGSKPDRQQKYSEALATLHKKYPDNIEVAAFYALSLLGVKSGWTQWESYNEEAAKIAADVLKKDPDHAGALHYLVHANDHPLHAKEGLEAANRYAIAASYAGHALHMPSHIYLALGMWDDVVRSNEVAWKASVDHKERKKLNNDDYSYHAHLWLFYGYLQQGNLTKAKAVLDKQIQYTKELPSAAARVHLLQMKGHYLFETGDWASPVAEIEIKTDDLMTGSQYNAMMIEGFKAFSAKNISNLDKVVADFEEKIKTDRQVQKANENISVCGVTRWVSAIPTRQEVALGEKLLSRLKGVQAWLRKDFVNAEKYLKESLPKEGAVVIGPPFYLTSSHDTYGEFLLDRKRYPEAFAQFGKALGGSPNRYATLVSQLRAAEGMKDANSGSRIRKQLAVNLKNGDGTMRFDD